ncbi:MAG: hypothetical protein EOM37_05430 [Proteobacteria bacterium]|nr:hypothetical protein [Pseudomonadota bacterium]
MIKNHPTPEEIYAEATEDTNFSSGDLRLLTSGLMALRAAKQETVNNIEVQALSGMIAYVAYTQEVDEVTVCEMLTAHYGVAEVKALPTRLYQNAIEFLVDLEVKKTVN